MSLGRKLGRLSSAGPGSKPAAPPAPELDSVEADDGWDAFRSALRSKVSREGRRAETRGEAMDLPGERVETADGPLRTIRTEHPLDASHGNVVHRALTTVDRVGLSRFLLDPDLAEVDPARLVFLDTETTGLAGAAGTVPFLIGVARIESSAMVHEQWLLERFGEEAPMLRRLADVLEDASGLVTYNGKSFDWPLLRARYVLHRLPIPRVSKHLDLVHGARRYFGPRLASVRLVDVERELLEFVREGDLDSSAIPQIFLDFQRTGAHPEMPRVIRHHALDLAAMPAMLVRFARIFGGEDRSSFALDRLALARVVARSGHDDDSRRLVRAIVDEEQGEAAAAASLVAAKQARRAGDLDSERVALERAVAEAGDDEVRFVALVALAKFLEHRAKDLVAALEFARLAHALEESDETERRVSRLARRIERGVAALAGRQ